MKGKKKVIFLGSALALIIASLSTATYAWFLSNTTADANNITGSAQSLDEAIFISKDGATWRAKVDVSDIMSNTILNPVQISGDNQFSLLDNTPGSSSRDYASVTLYFKVMDVSEDSVFNMVVDADIEESRDHPTLVADCFIGRPGQRQVIVHLGEALAMEVTPTTNADKNYLANSRYIKFGDDRDTNGRNAIYYYNNYMGYTGTANEIEMPDNYMDKYDEDSLFGSKYYTPSQQDYLESEKIPLFELQAGTNYEFSLTFNFYLEGWDIDCFSVLSGKGFEANLNFELVKKE